MARCVRCRLCGQQIKVKENCLCNLGSHLLEKHPEANLTYFTCPGAKGDCRRKGCVRFKNCSAACNRNTCPAVKRPDHGRSCNRHTCPALKRIPSASLHLGHTTDSDQHCDQSTCPVFKSRSCLDLDQTTDYDHHCGRKTCPILKRNSSYHRICNQKTCPILKCRSSFDSDKTTDYDREICPVLKRRVSFNVDLTTDSDEACSGDSCTALCRSSSDLNQTTDYDQVCDPNICPVQEQRSSCDSNQTIDLNDRTCDLSTCSLLRIELRRRSSCDLDPTTDNDRADDRKIRHRRKLKRWSASNSAQTSDNEYSPNTYPMISRKTSIDIECIKDGDNGRHTPSLVNRKTSIDFVETRDNGCGRHACPMINRKTSTDFDQIRDHSQVCNRHTCPLLHRKSATNLHHARGQVCNQNTCPVLNRKSSVLLHHTRGHSQACNPSTCPVLNHKSSVLLHHTKDNQSSCNRNTCPVFRQSCDRNTCPVFNHPCDEDTCPALRQPCSQSTCPAYNPPCTPSTCPALKCNEVTTYLDPQPFPDLHKTTVEKWQPSTACVVCPYCFKSGRPYIRKRRDKVAYTSIGSFCLMTFWPLCFLPIVMCGKSNIDIYCKHCGNMLGTYDRKRGKVVRPKRRVVMDIPSLISPV